MRYIPKLITFRY